MRGITRMVHDDLEAGLRFFVPPRWEIAPVDLVEPLTTAAYPSRGMSEEEAAEAERALWEEAMAPTDASPAAPRRAAALDVVDDDPEDFVVHLIYPRAIYLGRWDGLDEGPPDEEDVLAGADWLATGFREDFSFYPTHTLRGLDHGQRRVTVAGRPAAVAWYRFLLAEADQTDDGDERIGYLRLLLVHLGGDLVSFVVGLGQSRADRRLIDACLDSVEPLVSGPS
jgi:hypothetical protein